MLLQQHRTEQNAEHAPGGTAGTSLQSARQRDLEWRRARSNRLQVRIDRANGWCCTARNGLRRLRPFILFGLGTFVLGCVLTLFAGWFAFPVLLLGLLLLAVAVFAVLVCVLGETLGEIALSWLVEHSRRSVVEIQVPSQETRLRDPDQ